MFMAFCLLPNFEIQKYYQNEPKYNGVYSRNNLPKIKNWVFVINTLTAFELNIFQRKVRDNKNIKTNIYTIQASDS